MKLKSIVVYLFILVGIGLGFSALYTPQVNEDHKESFSAELAKEDIKVISEETHAVTQQESLAKVRTYLTDRLVELGVTPEVFTYPDVTDKYGNTFDVNNIFAKIDGQDGENGSYIMLVAHYDSSPKKREGEDANSKGAADDGYGIATILEIVRLLKETDQPLVNGVKILLTDAEETGLHGARSEMTENFELYENVSFVINLEARGIKGPAVMFETSSNNLKVIELYQEANLPVSYSLAADVYRKMPNGSDFTEFINKGLAGVNLAVLDNLDYYHTALDNYDNISITSLQHYGEQVYPMVKTFVTSEKYSDLNYFESEEDAIFFTLVPNVFITYSVQTGMILTVLALGLFVYALYRLKYSVRSVLVQTGKMISFAIVTLGIGVGISYILSIMFNIPFNLIYMPKIPNNNLIVMVVLLVMSIAFVGIQGVKWLKLRESLDVLIGGLGLMALLLVVFMFVLPGGSFLFLYPLVLGTLVLVLHDAAKKNSQFKLLYRVLTALVIVVVTMMFTPVLTLLHIALTIGALGVVLFIFAPCLGVVIPCVQLFMKQ